MMLLLNTIVGLYECQQWLRVAMGTLRSLLTLADTCYPGRPDHRSCGQALSIVQNRCADGLGSHAQGIE